MRPPRSADTAHRATDLAVAAALLLVLWVHLLGALVSALAAYVLYSSLIGVLGQRLPHRFAAAAALAATLAMVAAVLAGVAALVHATWAPHGGLPGLLTLLADILDRLHTTLPPWLASRIPESIADLQRIGADWLRTNAHALQRWGLSALRLLAQVVIGLVIGLLFAFDRKLAFRAPWAAEVQSALRTLAAAFANVVAAQVRIAAANAVFTGLFLLLALPLAGVHLPLASTLVVLTFVAGLIPIVGNLLSNGAILLVSLTVSPAVALAALCFLLAIHKLEYFLNAHFVGERTEVPPPVLLASMLVFEALFGPPGVLAAPIYCAWAFAQFSIGGAVHRH